MGFHFLVMEKSWKINVEKEVTLITYSQGKRRGAWQG